MSCASWAPAKWTGCAFAVRAHEKDGERFYLDTLEPVRGPRRSKLSARGPDALCVSKTAIEGDLAVMIRKLEAIHRGAQERSSSLRPALRHDGGRGSRGQRVFEEAAFFAAQSVKDLDTLSDVGEEVSKRSPGGSRSAGKLKSPFLRRGHCRARARASHSSWKILTPSWSRPEDVVALYAGHGAGAGLRRGIAASWGMFPVRTKACWAPTTALLWFAMKRPVRNRATNT